MTFQQLQYVLEVYRAGSVSQAAKNLFVGQSSVSLSISNLEKELGYPVFIRSTSGVVLTPRGRRKKTAQGSTSASEISMLDAKQRCDCWMSIKTAPIYLSTLGI